MNIRRLKTLIVKDAKQLGRDPSCLLPGVFLPVVLLLICGYGISTDIRNVKLAIVVPENSEFARRIVARFDSSEYFSVFVVRDTKSGEELVRRHIADACLYLPQDLSKRISSGDVRVFVAVNASNPALAYTKESYIRGVLATETARIAQDSGRTSSGGGAAVALKPRLWFNDDASSAATLVPGIIVIVSTMIGAMLTATTMAREYERGNLESLFVTPMKSSEILLAKTVDHFVLGAIGIAVSLLIARFLFNVPTRASWFVVPIGASVFLTTSLGMGLFISSVAKNQFIAVEIAAVTTFLPSFLLSGFLFEIKSMPLFLQWVTAFVPARYFVDFLQTAFLVGDVWSNFGKNLGILAGFAFFFAFLALRNTPKRLEA